TETDGRLARWRDAWIEDKDATNEEEVSNYQCLSNQIKHGYSIFLLWFKRNVSFIRVFIILGDVITFCIFLWVLVFATYLLTDPAIEKQHIIGIINNDTMPYPPEPEFDIQEYVSKIVAYHREAAVSPFSRAAAIISFFVCFTTLISTIGAAVSHGYSSITILNAVNCQTILAVKCSVFYSNFGTNRMPDFLVAKRKFDRFHSLRRISTQVSNYIVEMLEGTFDQYRSTADKKIHYLWDTIMGMVFVLTKRFHCCGLNNGHDFPEGLPDACCLRTTTGEKFDPYCNLYPGPLNSFFYIGCRKDVQKTIGDVRVQLTISMILLLLLQLWPFLLMTFLLQSGGIVTTFACRSPRHLRGLRDTSQWSASYAEQ
uniref:Tetraspanin n=1 Tax=Echinococcus canadensis TaxID=519352 RepID=A0A915EWF4_9CEST